MRAVALRCEHRADTPCIDTPAPRFSWALEGGERQSAYRIRVGEQWDSGRVASDQQLDVEYAGPPLPPASEFEWTVEIWEGDHAERSRPARFRTGLSEWHARWIHRDAADDPGVPAPSPDDDDDEMLRRAKPCTFLNRAFTLTAPVRRAVLYATARGVFEAHLNGERVGDAELAPGWTDYRKRIEYVAHDVTALIDDDNALQVVLGDGWYAGYVGFDPKHNGAHYGRIPEFLCELHIEHANGTRTVIVSDKDWRATIGPLRYADLLHGEYRDARRELGEWRPVATHANDAHLVAERAQPIRVTEQLEPIEVTEHDGAWIYDLGQNLVGRVRLTVEGEAGTKVTLRHAEMLEPDGSLHLANLRTARQLDTFVLSGNGHEVFEPRFTFHGFRYVEVRGAEPIALVGRVLHSDTPRSGWFECSDELVNQLWRNLNWGQRGNFLSVPTDCPQRDERLGWLADAQVFLPTASLNMDVAAFITKWGDDVLDAQSAEGAYPDVAPRLVADRDGAPAWADAGIIVPWLMWRRYGDKRLVARHWDAMERYLAYLQRHNPDLLWRERRNNDYGDWLSIGADTPKDVLGTAYWALDAKLMADMARALGKRERARHYERMRSGVAGAFNRAYVHEDGSIEGDTQTVYLLALHVGLGDADQAIRRLVADIEAHGDHLTTGFVGVGLLCPVLSEHGHSDLAHRLLRQETFPSWGYSIRQGATTIWERWDGWTEEHGFQTPAMNSFNHYSLGSVGQWLYEYVAGIRALSPGYGEILVAPEPGGLESFDATYHSVRGPIRSAWREGELIVEIPPNVTAFVRPPGEARVQVGPGRHTFRAITT